MELPKRNNEHLVFAGHGKTQTASELEVGDLVFGTRPGWFADFCRAAGVPWRHVGFVFEADPLTVIELGPKSISTRTITEFVCGYDLSGYAQLKLSSDCKSLAVAAAKELENTEAVYAWDDVIMAGFISLSRKRHSRELLDNIEDLLQKVAETGVDLKQAPNSYTCSSFVYSVFESAGINCSVGVDFTVPVGTRNAPGVSIDSFLGLPITEQVELLESYALLELLDLSEAEDFRSVPIGDLPTVTQLHRAARLLAALGRHGGRVDPETVHSRAPWVTPGDLWNSSAVLESGLLTLDVGTKCDDRRP